jgi:hypothetical protein
MKNVNKLRLTFLMTIGVFFFSCQNQEDFSSEIQQSTAEIDTSKLIDFKGLLVNHRFATPIEDLEKEHSLKFLKQMYQTSKFEVAKRKGISFKTNNSELPSAALIVESAKKIIEEFPYGLIPEDAIQEIDSSVKLEKSEQNREMIKADFPTLTEQEIQENIDLIDEYYEQNLDYTVFNDISENEQEYTGRIANKNSNFSYSQKGGRPCVANLVKIVFKSFVPFNLIKGTIAIMLATPKASVSAGNYYPDVYGDYYGYSGGGGSNTRGDAYRHTLWNALLADYYFTISAKNPRIGFAKLVTDTYENCTSGEVDSKEMDYHNNAIGRKIWYDDTTYVTFFGGNTGLNTPSTSRIKDLVREAVDKKSCFLKKTILNGANKDYEDAEIKAKILQEPSDIIVYFEGTIAPSRYKYNYVFSHWEYYDCDNPGDNGLGHYYKGDKPKKCKRAIYTKKRVEIVPCSKS